MDTACLRIKKNWICNRSRTRCGLKNETIAHFYVILFSIGIHWQKELEFSVTDLFFNHFFWWYWMKIYFWYCVLFMNLSYGIRIVVIGNRVCILFYNFFFSGHVLAVSARILHLFCLYIWIPSFIMHSCSSGFCIRTHLSILYVEFCKIFKCLSRFYI